MNVAFVLAYLYAMVSVFSAPRDFDGIKQFLTDNVIEGLVWHHDDGRMAKIKRRDFGLKW